MQISYTFKDWWCSFCVALSSCYFYIENFFLWKEKTYSYVCHKRVLLYRRVLVFFCFKRIWITRAPLIFATPERQCTRTFHVQMHIIHSFRFYWCERYKSLLTQTEEEFTSSFNLKLNKIGFWCSRQLWWHSTWDLSFKKNPPATKCDRSE